MAQYGGAYEALSECVLSTWAQPCQGSQCLRPMWMAKTSSGPDMDVMKDLIWAKNSVYTQTSTTASSSQREDCKPETAPLQRHPTEISYYLLPPPLALCTNPASPFFTPYSQHYNRLLVYECTSHSIHFSVCVLCLSSLHSLIALV